MEKLYKLVLEVLRKIYQKTMRGHRSAYVMPEDIGLSPEQSSDIVFNKLNSDAPCMIARFGSTELQAIQNCLAVESSEHSALKYIRGQQPQWWWMDSAIKQLERWSGFFPSNPETISKFTKLMIEDSKELDVLALWIGREKAMPLPQHCKFIHLLMLEPYWSSKPWSKALEGKNVVVVHPFAELIENQYYNHRTELFDNPDVLPNFNLRTVKAVQSLGGECEFNDWFDALRWMENEIDKQDYDICLIGCGAYGFPLAAHCKRQGKKAIHMGGALQLLFGIKGNRWENSNYARNWHMKPGNFYLKMLSNKNWVRPDNYRTERAEKVEGACYW
ncbi:hypothetical protein [Fibrobacter succinogenes]|uniref:hypothetical protein n=1 Tax=Fibrobacter succinogenes TaxID=833 RepID=UPI0015693136|nr:hypothetical protein [Fibrobacter succinogenes]